MEGEFSVQRFQIPLPPSIIVFSAGNDHPKSITKIRAKASKDFDVIIVGSLSPEGIRSDFSQQGEEVHIMAPSNSEIASVDQNGNLINFGGTSGAAPLVTGSLAGFEWLSGYHPTAEEAKILLEQTAIPIPHSHENPRMNGVGMVNAYKLGMVGEEFKRLCGTNISCFKEMIRNPAAYKFPEDLGLEEAVKQAFPGCSQTCGKNVTTCADKDSVFKRLRKAAFLNPEHKPLWRYMACIYNSADFMRNTEGASNTYKALFGPSENGREAYTICKSDSDCMIAPCRPSVIISNAGSSGFWAITKAEAEMEYATGFCKGVLCNEKCRCDNEETFTVVYHLPCTPDMSQSECFKSRKSPNKMKVTATSRCVNSQCIMQPVTQPTVLPKEPSQNQEVEATPSGQSSGQR